MNISIKSAHIENFKGIKCKDISFGNKTSIKGANATGKTTIVDAILWLLFGKNSQYVEKFEVRPLDDNGNQINFVDIIVSAVIDVDGTETELKKTQKQNWVKQRGSEQATFQGNVNSYEINGFPKSDKEFKAFINDIISEDLFKILTNPTYFPSMKWKEQRDILMKFAVRESDLELATSMGGFDDLLNDLSMASTDDILKKYTKSLKELKSSQTEIPVRIDELSKQKVEFDVAELELQKTALEEQLNIKVDKSELENLKTERFNLGFEISAYERKANESVMSARRDVEISIVNEQDAYRKAENKMCSADSEISNLENRIKTAETESANLGSEYSKVKGTSFDESKAICPMCGQNLPTDKVTELKGDFFNKQKSQLDVLVKRGYELKDVIDKAKAQLIEKKADLEKTEKEMSDINSKISELKLKLNNLPQKADLGADPEYKNLTNKAEELDAKIKALESDVPEVNTYDIKLELEQINAKLSQAQNNINIDTRISELMTEQKEIAQKIADCEKMIYLAETLIKAKLNAISESVNSRFECVNFRLWKSLINGGMEEDCAVTWNGVDYANLNSGHKIIAGMDICRTLSKFYEVSPFMFIDNAESINEFNLLDMDCQLISLSVTGDKEMVVE